MDQQSSVNVSWRTVLLVLLVLLVGAVVGHGLLKSGSVSDKVLVSGEKPACGSCPSSGVCQVDVDCAAVDEQATCAAGSEMSGCVASQSGCPLATPACGVGAGSCGVGTVECAERQSDEAPACCGSATIE